MTVFDKNNTTTQKLYSQDAEYINNEGRGIVFGDRLHDLLEFHRTTSHKPLAELMAADIDKAVTNKLQKLGLI